MPPLETAAEEAPPVPPPFAAVPPLSADLGEPAEPSIKPPSGFNGSEPEEHVPEPLPAWLAAPPVESPRNAEESNFEAVWPAAEDRTASRMAPEDTAPSEPEVEPEAAASASERRTVAILKSGVVDGMGYTLYVDGSIEAELPQGTLRFASINDLREHLEKTS